MKGTRKGQKSISTINPESMPIIRTCRISGKEFTISDKEIALLDKLSPIIGWEKFSLPHPMLSPEERRRRRLQFKNYFFLHKRRCDLTGKNIVSTFSKDAKNIVWNQEDYWSDKFDGTSYKQDINWEDDFNVQFHKFILWVPQMALDNAYKLLINSEYINGNGESKDCYLVSCGSDNDKCLYAWFLFSCSSMLNVNYGRFSELCSFSSHIWKCYDVHFAFDASECRNSRYIFSCEGSQYLIGCVWLKNQKYHILNHPCTEKEYSETLERLKTDEVFCKEFIQRFYSLIGKLGIQKNILTGSIDSSGDFCYDSKNAYESYGSGDIRDCAYVYDCYDAFDSMDIDNWWENLRLSYDSISTGRNASHIYWSMWSWGGAEYHFYCHACTGGSYLFGCSWLRWKSYCIFNKQYSKEEWEEVVKKLIKKMWKSGEWWEFFNPQYAWYPYDASHAMAVFPVDIESYDNRRFSHQLSISIESKAS